MTNTFRILLKQSGKTKKELGDELGVSATTVSRWHDNAPKYALSYLEATVHHANFVSNVNAICQTSQFTSDNTQVTCMLNNLLEEDKHGKKVKKGEDR